MVPDGMSWTMPLEMSGFSLRLASSAATRTPDDLFPRLLTGGEEGRDEGQQEGQPENGTDRKLFAHFHHP
jgi:hypothetical protein